MALRVEKSNASEIGRSHAASPDRFSSGGIAGLVAIATSCFAGLSSLSLGNGTMSVLCLALLLFGLPHGGFDIALIRRGAQMGGRQVVAVTSLYLGFAAAMYVTWSIAPVFALASFLVIASIHFAEDWTDSVPPFFAIGIAAAVLTAPALFHPQTVASIFMTLTGQENAATIADFSVLAAPVALIAAAVGIGLMIRARQVARALEAGVAIAGMALLPPIAGFAIFFCLMHSPRHFAAARAEASGRDREMALMSCAAIGIAALIYASQGAIGIEDKAIVASFMTLSILTVPHMIVPRLADAESRRQVPAETTAHAAAIRLAANSAPSPRAS